MADDKKQNSEFSYAHDPKEDYEKSKMKFYKYGKIFFFFGTIAFITITIVFILIIVSMINEIYNDIVNPYICC